MRSICGKVKWISRTVRIAEDSQRSRTSCDKDVHGQGSPMTSMTDIADVKDARWSNSPVIGTGLLSHPVALG